MMWTLTALLLLGVSAAQSKEVDPRIDTQELVVPSLFRIVAQKSWCEQMEEEKGWFRCHDRKEPWCIDPVLQCDNTRHCQDGSDELDCPDNAPEVPHRDLSAYCPKCSSMDQLFLNLSNDLRREEWADNMNELQWSPAVAAKAKEWAEQCKLPNWGENPHGMMDPDLGQNVGRWYRKDTPPEEDFLDIVRAWYREADDYDYDNNQCNGPACGHYKAMTTAYSRELGCALVKCERTKEEETVYFWNIVCNYRPWPNWKVWSGHPQQPFIQGKQCHKCQPGLTCRSNLCA